MNGGGFYCFYADFFVNNVAKNSFIWYNYKDYYSRKGCELLDISTGDILVMKKQHPCGSDGMKVLRAGADFKLRCTGCGHEFMVPRSKCEKKIKEIIRGEYNNA